MSIKINNLPKEIIKSNSIKFILVPGSENTYCYYQSKLKSANSTILVKNDDEPHYTVPKQPTVKKYPNDRNEYYSFHQSKPQGGKKRYFFCYEKNRKLELFGYEYSDSSGTKDEKKISNDDIVKFLFWANTFFRVV